MSLNLLNTFAQIGTFVVIAATAIAAMIQLRHLGQSNKLQAILALRAERNNSVIDDAFAFVSDELHEKLNDPVFRSDLENNATPSRKLHKELSLADYYEHVGVYLRKNLIDEDIYFEIANPGRYWKVIEPAIALYRRKRGNRAFDNFEYLVLREREWNRTHPDGAFSEGQLRLEIADPYLDADGG